jgi:hypothetical protein
MDCLQAVAKEGAIGCDNGFVLPDSHALRKVSYV